MSDERTWEDQQDSLDYRQWKAEQDWERAHISNVSEAYEEILWQLRQDNIAINAEIAGYKARIAELEAEVQRLKRDQRTRIDAQLVARGISPQDG